MINKKGFTLIEMLVVVLIIGILAAIAVPKYQKAVLKSRATEAMTMLKAIGEAQEVYYLAHGHYTTDLTDLDINVPSDKVEPVDEDGKEIMQEHYAYRCWSLGCGAESSRADWPSFELDFIHTNLGRRGKLSCRVHPSENKSELARSICLEMSSTYEGSGYYVIN